MTEKCINKRFAESINEFLRYGKEKRNYYASAAVSSLTYGSVLDITIRTYDDIVMGEDDGRGYCGSYRISNAECFLRLPVEEVTTKTDGGKYRINAKGLVEKFDEKIQYLNDKAVELEMELTQVETMRADLEQIKQLMNVFNGKYHGRIKDVFNCNYFLKDNNGMQYR